MDDQTSKDEIAALKARLNELEGGPKLVGQARPQAATRTNWVVAISIGLVGLAVFGVNLTNWLGGGSVPVKAPGRAEPVRPAICNKAWARRFVETADNSPLISGMDLEPGVGLIVVVRRAQWEFLSLEQQKVLAAGIDCHIAGPDYLAAIHFRHSRHGPDLYRVTAIDLHRLREDGAAAGG